MAWQELKWTRVCVIMDVCTSYAGGEKFVNSNDSSEMMLQSVCVLLLKWAVLMAKKGQA